MVTSVHLGILPSFLYHSQGKLCFAFQVKFQMSFVLQNVYKLDKLTSTFKRGYGACQHSDWYITSRMRKKYTVLSKQSWCSFPPLQICSRYITLTLPFLNSDLCTSELSFLIVVYSKFYTTYFILANRTEKQHKYF